jgi:hypothetical protein
MDDSKLPRREFLGKMAAILGGLAAVPLLTRPALADPPFRRRRWVWSGRRWNQQTAPRRWRARTYDSPAYSPPATAPRGYRYVAPRGGSPVRPGSIWGGSPGYFPPMLDRSPLPYANPLSPRAT